MVGAGGCAGRVTLLVSRFCSRLHNATGPLHLPVRGMSLQQPAAAFPAALEMHLHFYRSWAPPSMPVAPPPTSPHLTCRYAKHDVRVEDRPRPTITDPVRWEARAKGLQTHLVRAQSSEHES